MLLSNMPWDTEQPLPIALATAILALLCWPVGVAWDCVPKMGRQSRAFDEQGHKHGGTAR